MASMGDIGVLTKEEEVQLAAIIHLGQEVCCIATHAAGLTTAASPFLDGW